jgi:hypothetical protein
MADKRDLIDDLAHTIKEHPVESLAAYELLVPKEKKKEIEQTAVGMGVILVALILIVPLLFAPAFYGVITDPIRDRKWATPNITAAEIEKMDSQMRWIKIGVWIVAIFSWTVLLVVLFLANDERIVAP